jgi:hypothetical protein
MLPPSILSSTNRLALVFKSDRSIHGGGFSARIEGVDVNVDCDRTFTAASGNITSIGYPASIDRLLVCNYHIVVSQFF